MHGLNQSNSFENPKMPDPMPPTPYDHVVVATALRGRLSVAYQPIIDLHRAETVGYEAFMRYGGLAGSAPLFSARELLASARRVGQTVELEAAAVRQALLARDDMPHNQFLSLNVSGDALLDDRTLQELQRQGSLDGVMIELGDHTGRLEPGDVDGRLADLKDPVDALRDRGAVFAITDVSIAPRLLDEVLHLEPAFIKLDRQLVTGLAGSRAKLALVSSLRHLAERLEMGVIAQGIEQYADLRSLERLGVHLGQGYLLAHPSSLEQAASASSPVTAMLETGQADESLVAALVEPACLLSEHELDQPLRPRSEVEFEVIVSDLGEPLALLRRVPRGLQHLSFTTVDERTSIRVAALHAMRRSAAIRFDPLVVVDEMGACTGVVRIDALIDRLVLEATGSGRPLHLERPIGRRSGRHPRPPR